MSRARFLMSTVFIVALLACSKEKNEAPQAQVQPTPQAPPVEQTIATAPETVAAPRAGKLQPAAKRSQTAAAAAACSRSHARRHGNAGPDCSGAGAG